MMKRIFLVVLILAITGVSIFFYFESKQKAVMGTTLSARSKQFLAQQGKVNAGNVDYANLKDKSKDKPGTQEIKDECFVMTVPFQVKTVRRDGECDLNFQIMNPRGNVVVYKRVETVESLDTVPGVSMRRQSPHAYQESKIRVGNQDFLLFRNKTVGGYEVNAFTNLIDGYFVVNLTAYTSQPMDSKMKEMLQSVEFK